MTSLAALASKGPVLPARARASAVIGRELLDRVHDAQAREALVALLARFPAAHDLLAGVLAHSPFLAQAMRQAPAALLATLQMEPDARMASLVEAVQTVCLPPADTAHVMRALRQFRRDVALLVALADMGRVWDVAQVTAALTNCADTAVQLACTHALRQMADLGRINLANADDPGAGTGLVVLALGKHGACELNYSSDIDIVVFYDPEVALSAGVAEPPSFFVKLTQLIARIIQERTPDGYVFRVDLRLRPDPGSTHVAVSLPMAYSYYETVGQNWERAAYIKARPIAGDMALGARFLADLAPFIWRKYFDFAAIADIHAMKRQIQAVKGHDIIAVAGHNVKLGRGGIREIEFFVQTQQLVFGGRRPALRGPRTIAMLGALTDEGWITPRARDELRQAYEFLRTVEHRLQMRHDEQTQTLPTSAADLEGFARFCGFASTATFSKALTSEARRVEDHYARLFEDAPTLASSAGALSFTGKDNDPATLETLKKLGFRDTVLAAETVRGWHFGRRPAVTTARAREVLTEVTPALLVALGRTIDPDGALNHLDSIFMRMPAAAELLTLLRSREAFLTLFADILGSAPRLSTVAAMHPHVLDGVIDPAFISAPLDVETLKVRIRAMVGSPPPSVEDGLDRMRDAVRQKLFLVGARLLSGVIDAKAAGHAYAAIAQASIQVALEDTRAAFQAEHGVVEGAELVVIGLGRLGAGELTASSDLDLLVLYDRPENAGSSDGARPLDPVTYHVRLVQRLVAALTVPTRRGTLWQVDLRLRPSGNKSPAATQFDGFVDYHASEAEIWEQMALTRARVVAGDAGLAARAEAAIRTILTRRREPKTVAFDVSQMRALIAKEKGEDNPDDLKLAAGGLTDLDFLAQYLILAHAADVPALLAPDTPATLMAAAETGLMPRADVATLLEAHALISTVQQWQRFCVDGAFDSKLVPARVQKRIATASSHPDARVLAAHLSDLRRQVRAIFAARVVAGS